jgi:PncC family amidohydrolase
MEKRLGAILVEREWTICGAESCTGGLLLHRLTNNAGSSAYVQGGVIAYSNAMKQNVLRVKQGTLMAHGAVSAPVAEEMALGAQKLFRATIAVSVTGIAGPGGGTAEKPVGLTYIGVAIGETPPVVERYHWDGDRIANKEASVDAALALVLRLLEGETV